MNKRFGGVGGRLLVAAVAVGALLVISMVGSAGAGGLWFLLVLAWPLMMLIMMGSMLHRADADGGQRHVASGGDIPDSQGLTREEQTRLLRGETRGLDPALRQLFLHRRPKQIGGEALKR